MTLDVIDDINALAELAPEWRELVQNSAAPSPFLTPEWLLAWWTHLAGSRTLHVLVVREEGRLMALAPLLVARGPLGVGSRLEFLGAGHAGSDYLDVIVRAGHEHEGLAALAEELRDETRALRLDHVAESALSLRLSDSLSQCGWTWQRSNVSVCPIVALAGHTWDSYLGSLGASHRANFRRRLRGLTGKFELTFDRVASEADRRDALDAVVGFHEQRFGAGGSTAFLSTALKAFHHDATRHALERGWLRMHVLRLNGAIAAAMYGFMYNGRFYFYQHGFDSQYQPLSVGLVLMGLTIQAALEDGALEFDMLYGTESYKRLWARDERPLLNLQLFPRRLAGLFYRGTADAERTMRTVARRILAIGAARAS